MAGAIDNMQQDIGINRRLQRRLKRIDQRMGQITNEPDRIRNDDIAGAPDPQLARGGIERRKQLIGGINTGMGERVESVDLPALVAHQRNVEHITAASCLALHATLATTLLNDP